MTRKIAGETIIVPIRNHVGDLNSIYTLNEVGTMIWDLLDEKATVKDIVKAICQEYATWPEIAHKDTLHFLNDLEKEGLVQQDQKAWGVED